MHSEIYELSAGPSPILRFSNTAEKGKENRIIRERTGASMVNFTILYWIFHLEQSVPDLVIVTTTGVSFSIFSVFSCLSEVSLT